MRPPPFDYLEPTTVAEACAELDRHRDRCAVLAGGQSLVAQLNARLIRPDFVLSIARIPELAAVEATDAGIRIGAAVTQREVQRGLAGDTVPVLREALERVGHVPTRNRGTVGGSIAFADPTAELPAVLLALGGTVVLRSAGGERTVPAGEFWLGPFRTGMRPDELLVAVSIPVPAGGVWAFEQRHFRRHAKVSVVAGTAGDGILTVAAAGLTDTAVLLPDAAARFSSCASPSEGIAAVAAGVADLVTPNADHYGSPAYRRRLAVAATEAALRRVPGLAPETEAA
ncbi:MAG TPA: FAD binding domain-containing protein [Pseudonocardia sp.]|nr:FAD binding domain-containing protein [Pseudonocardia sp.]